MHKYGNGGGSDDEKGRRRGGEERAAVCARPVSVQPRYNMKMLLQSLFFADQAIHQFVQEMGEVREWQE